MAHDFFVPRKKRKISTSSPTSISGSSHATNEAKVTTSSDEDSTDYKLALLSSLYPKIEQHVLLDILLAHNGSIDDTAMSLKTHSSTSKNAAIGYQSSLPSYVSTVPNLIKSAKKPTLLSKRGRTVHLYSPEDVAANTPCSIIHNFLPADEANDLLRELLEEAPTFGRMTFKLFDNVVQSPHTTCFYVEGSEEQNVQKTEYIYNGDRLDSICTRTFPPNKMTQDVRLLTPQMRKASPKVQQAVNREIWNRIRDYHDGKKLPYQSPHQWQPNAACVNCYAGPTESVGYHSDQLTYLGPRATIGSISLGVSREFRVRRIVPQEDDSKSKELSDAEGQIAIHLPHNSLLVMHAEMQEEWKHSIAPAKATDPHPISGNKRINITYRDYKKELHPKNTPRCSCHVPAVLRVVQRKKENWGKYFWMCHAGNVPEKVGCSFFAWAEFDDDGTPIWDKSKDERKTGGH